MNGIKINAAMNENKNKNSGDEKKTMFYLSIYSAIISINKSEENLFSLNGHIPGKRRNRQKKLL